MAVNWEDRVPTYPNRMKITPETGDPYYATVERADNPSVVGTPVNARNLNAMQEASGLTANRTVYVSTAGSDSVGDGSEANPYATINKALATIPRNLNGFTAAIIVAAGTYAESVLVANFGNGTVRITGAEGAGVNVNGLEANNVKLLEITNIALNISSGFFHVVSSGVRVTAPVTTNGAAYGVYATNFSDVVFASTLTINNTTNYAVVSTSGSRIYVTNIAGSGNKVTFASTLGGICAFGVDSSSVTGAQYFTDTGGRIYSGSQASIPSY